MNLHDLDKLTRTFSAEGRMPVLFLGHGSPMNAIEENDFVRGFRKVAQEIPKPRAILCVSAHWETRGTFLTAMENPRTIHDFGGFPRELFDVRYPAPGSPELAQEAKALARRTEIGLDMAWGLDHGCWSVVKHLYPEAEVPVIQMSLDRTQAPRNHYALAAELRSLREKGVLVVGSGNIVHNLAMVDWRRLDESFGHDWALEASERIKGHILDGDHLPLIDYTAHGREFQLSIPTPDHYLPLLYALAMKGEDEPVRFFNDVPVAGAITMTSLVIG